MSESDKNRFFVPVDEKSVANGTAGCIILGEQGKGRDGMGNVLIYNLERYLPPHTIPLYVEEVKPGCHPARQVHGHTFMEIVLVLAGKGVHLAGEAAAEISAGDVLLVYPGILHGYDRTETLGLVNLVYDPQYLALPLLDGNRMPLFQRFMVPRTPSAPEQVVQPLLHLTRTEQRRAASRIRRLAAEIGSERPGRMFFGLALFMELITELCRSETATATHTDMEYLVGEAIRYMHNHLPDTIRMEALAGLVNMSRRNFFRHFRNATGKTPAEYLKELRLASAMELLRHSDLPIGEVALRCGFCDGNYIGHLFRERLDTTPRRFRAACRTDNPGH